MLYALSGLLLKCIKLTDSKIKIRKFDNRKFYSKIDPSPGARFSKDPITFRARKASFNDLYLKKNAVL